MHLKAFFASTFVLLDLTVGVSAAAVERHAADTTSPSKCSTATSKPTAYDTLAYESALANAPASVRDVAKMVAIAEANPMDRTPIAWSGHGLNCDASDNTNSVSQKTLQFYSLFMGGMDMNYMYREHEHIACIPSPLGIAQTCMFLENNLTPLSGLKVVVLYNILYNHQCQSVGQVPIRMIEEGNVNDLRDGVLKIDVVSDSSGCEGLCGKHAPDPSEHLTTDKSDCEE